MKRTNGHDNTDYGMQPVFRIAGDLSKVPAEDLAAHQYLLSVQHQAATRTMVSVVNKVRETTTEDPHRSKRGKYDDITIRTEFEYWQLEIFNDFMQLKHATQTLRQQYLNKGSGSHDNDNSGPHPIDRAEAWSPPKNTPSWRKYLWSNEPLPLAMVFKHFDHVTVMKLIASYASWLSSNSNENLCKWIYILFLRLDNQLDHNDCSLVRAVARKAIKLLHQRDTVEGWKPNAIVEFTCHFIIIVANKYFSQKDLFYDNSPSDAGV